LVEIERVILADRPAVQFDRLFRQRVGDGLARFAGDDVVPRLAQVGVFPEIGLEGLGLRHATLPLFSAFCFCRLAEFVIWYNQFSRSKNQAAGEAKCPSSNCPTSRKLSR